MRAAVLALAVLSLGSAGALAEDGASDWFTTDQGRLRLVNAGAEPGSDGSLLLGLEFRLAPGWKIYWRAPGDAGYPPAVDWRESENLAGTTMLWPSPHRFTLFGIDTVGYSDAVVLPIRAKLVNAAAATHLVANVDYLTCSQICVPYQTSLALEVPAPTAGPSNFAPLVSQYLAQVPGDGAREGLALKEASIEPGRKPALLLKIQTAQALAAPDAFVEGPPGIGFGRPVALLSPDRATTLLRIPVEGDPGAAEGLVGTALSVTLVDGQRAMEGHVSPLLGEPAFDLLSLLPMIGLALLGGLILNLMPCVRPVLSMKILGLVAHSHEPPHRVRLGFLATSAGILVSFLALGLVMVGLKSAGVAVGWGIQFQQPLFLAVMAALLTLFAANLWGAFEIPLPARLSGVAGVGYNGPALLSNFLTGVFATLLATPCSAPFLGTAVGFALASGPVDILAIFLALGVGLAIPYLLVAAAPRVAGWLPRPGRWMLGLRRVLGLALAATVVWLLWVIATQIGWLSALSAAVPLGLAVVILLLPSRALRRLGVPAALVLALALPLALAAPAKPVATDAYWQPFDKGAIEGLVQRGQVVFVDVTASWCLTCQVNERLVLETGPVRKRLSGSEVVAMRADWTRPSDLISAYLRSFGRYGIPFNAVYGPGAPNGLPLPEILTQGIVEDALTKALGRPRAEERAVVGVGSSDVKGG